jgi:hypothetical protein
MFSIHQNQLLYLLPRIIVLQYVVVVNKKIILLKYFFRTSWECKKPLLGGGEGRHRGFTLKL